MKSKNAVPSFIVATKVVTWTKDSHGLFDYESSTLNQKKLHINQTGTIYRDPDNSDVHFKNKDELKKVSNLVQNNILLEIEKTESSQKEDKYMINIREFSDQKKQENEDLGADGPLNNIYLIVRSLKDNNNHQKGYSLQLGDILKLGRIKCVVSEIKVDDNSKSIKTKDFDLEVEKEYEVTQPLKGVCKFCLSDEETQNNFFVAPCNCKGSCEIVHLNCLKQWIQSKIVCKKEETTISYNFTKFQCQICKDPFPKFIKKGQTEYQLFYIQRPKNPYIILQSLNNEGKGNRTLYLISKPNSGQFVKLGRGHQCEIRVTDISVSRQHARISYDGGKFIVFDNNSKFGTLIKLQKSLPIRMDQIAVQIGRTVITCELKNDDLFEHQSHFHRVIYQKTTMILMIDRSQTR